LSQPVILVEKKDGLAVVTLNRPQAMNAMSWELRQALTAALEELALDPDLRVVILTGAGRAFCAGMDLKELSTEAGFGQPEEGPIGLKLFQTIWGFDRPIIGAVNGPAVTGGFELALGCDILYASTEARFADTHARLGLRPGGGLSQKLPRIIGEARAKEMSFTGNFINADQALAWGLVNRVLPPDQLLPACRTLAQDIISCVPAAIKDYKKLITTGMAKSLEEGLRLEGEMYDEQARKFSPAGVAARRQGVMDRGREQKNR